MTCVKDIINDDRRVSGKAFHLPAVEGKEQFRQCLARMLFLEIIQTFVLYAAEDIDIVDSGKLIDLSCDIKHVPASTVGTGHGHNNSILPDILRECRQGHSESLGSNVDGNVIGLLDTMGEVTYVCIPTKGINADRIGLTLFKRMTITVVAHLLQAVIGRHTGKAVHVLDGIGKPFDVIKTVGIELGQLQHGLLRTELMTETASYLVITTP